MTIDLWLDWLTEISSDMAPVFSRLDALEERHTQAILRAFHRVRLGQHHFAPTTGYGYDDSGRTALESAVCELWGTEAALVRQQIATGTQAINLCLQALAEPGGEILFAREPYETLQVAVGMKGHAPGNLGERGVSIKTLPDSPGSSSLAGRVADGMSGFTRLVYLQRSGGYSARPSWSIRSIAEITKAVKAKGGSASPPVFVDNCYGEFVEEMEPTQAGADLMAGSLIKNPGGGLAPSGGYIAGRRDLVERVAAVLYGPGQGGEIGPSLISPRLLFQGLFSAPHLVGQALRGAVLCARAFEMLGYEVNPPWDEPRYDLVQMITFGTPESLLTFCRALQGASPVNAHVFLEPALLPGYTDPVVMAGGTFVEGSSSELTIDAPMRPPFAGYWQGGLSYSHAKIALAHGLHSLFPDGPPVIDRERTR